jgi:SnoaL-like polyketide cyclase
MEQQKQNKEFIIRYFNALSGVIKTRELLEQYITDEELIGHGIFFDTVFPKYEVIVDEMIAEGNKVVVRGRMKGHHEGDFMGISPTHRSIEQSAVICYEIENGKIVHHWIMADTMVLMEQLGVMNVPA